MVVEGCLLKDVIAGHGIDEVGLTHNGVVFSGQGKDVGAEFFGFDNAVDAKFTAMVFEEFGQTFLYAVVCCFTCTGV